MKLKPELVDLLNPKNTALLVIDIQRGYCSKNEPLPERRKFNTAPIESMIPKLENFIKKARRQNIPIIWTRMIEDPNFGPKNLKKKMEIEKWMSITTPGKSSFEYYKIKPQKGDKEFVKTQYDAFTNKDLQKYLRNKKIKTLILTGVYTSRCVDSTMRGAFTKGYNIVIAEDLVAMPKQLRNEHNATLSVCKVIFGFVLQSRDISDVWSSTEKP